MSETRRRHGMPVGGRRLDVGPGGAVLSRDRPTPDPLVGRPVVAADWSAALVAFLLAFPIGTLVEYLLHRFFLHARSRNFVTRRHRLHHKSNQADTLWGDFRDFLPGMLPVCWLGFPFGVAAGIGFVLGGVAYVFVLALVHKLSHERPRLVFWMSPNSHDLHHGATPRHNFGIVVRFWDVVFGTYSAGRAKGNA